LNKNKKIDIDIFAQLFSKVEMKQLYEYNDLFDVIKDYILPCLTYSFCEFCKTPADLNALACVSKKLKINIQITTCKHIKICGKKVCNIHCRALPIYKYINNVFIKHSKTTDTFIHFKKKWASNIFMQHYHPYIRRRRYGKLVTCCGGKGFATHISSEKRQAIVDEYLNLNLKAQGSEFC